MESRGSPGLVFPGVEEIWRHVEQGPRQAHSPLGTAHSSLESRVDWGRADMQLVQPSTATGLVHSCCPSP